jgi:transcriptional regulator with XRE-family HTH domain
VTLLEEVRLIRRLPNRALARALREGAGLSRARIAEELGVHQASIARWERGDRRPRGTRAVAYASLLRQLQEELSA